MRTGAPAQLAKSHARCHWPGPPGAPMSLLVHRAPTATRPATTHPGARPTSRQHLCSARVWNADHCSPGGAEFISPQGSIGIVFSTQGPASILLHIYGSKS